MIGAVFVCEILLNTLHTFKVASKKYTTTVNCIRRAHPTAFLCRQRQ